MRILPLDLRVKSSICRKKTTQQRQHAAVGGRTQLVEQLEVCPAALEGFSKHEQAPVRQPLHLRHGAIVHLGLADDDGQASAFQKAAVPCKVVRLQGMSSPKMGCPKRTQHHALTPRRMLRTKKRMPTDRRCGHPGVYSLFVFSARPTLTITIPVVIFGLFRSGTSLKTNPRAKTPKNRYSPTCSSSSPSSCGAQSASGCSGRQAKPRTLSSMPNEASIPFVGVWGGAPTDSRSNLKIEGALPPQTPSKVSSPFAIPRSAFGVATALSLERVGMMIIILPQAIVVFGQGHSLTDAIAIG